MSSLLQLVDDKVLMFGGYLGEPIRRFDDIRYVHAVYIRSPIVHRLQARLPIERLAHSQQSSRFFPYQQMISRNHLNVGSHSDSPLDRLLGIVARRVVEGEDAHELPVLVLFVLAHGVVGQLCAGYSEGSKTAFGVLFDYAIDFVLDFVSVTY